MKTEYLISIDKSQNIAIKTSAFRNMLSSVDGIKINDNIIKFNNKSFNYSLQLYEIRDTDYICYHLVVECACDTDDLKSEYIKQYQELLRRIRQILNNQSMKFEILWDDISYKCSQKAYPLIYEIENLTRKLLTKFMLINIGTKWEKENIPSAINQSKNNQKNINQNNGLLYRLDFIELSDFLFKEYPLKSDLSELIKYIKEKRDIPCSLAENFVPKSNWDRYFKDIVSVEGAHLKNQWEKLYELRCKIAHNNYFTITDFQQVTEIIDDLKPSIEKAIDTLDKITVDSSDKEMISESYAICSNEQIGTFVLAYKRLFDVLSQLCGTKHFGMMSINMLASRLLDSHKITKEQYNMLKICNFKRNKIVHEPNSVSADEIDKLIIEIELLTQELAQIPNVEEIDETKQTSTDPMQ